MAVSTEEMRQALAAEQLDKLAAKVRSGEIRMLEWSVSAESVEGDDGTLVTRTPTGFFSMSMRYQRKPPTE